MSRTTSKMMKSLMAAVVVAALVAPAAGAYVGPLHPREAGNISAPTQGQDLRSPDARDAGQVASSPSPGPTPTGDSTGTDWGYVSILGGVALGLSTLGGLVLYTRNRGTGRQASRPRRFELSPRA